MKPASILLAAASAAAAQSVVEIGINRVKPGQKGLTRRSTIVETLANNFTGGGYYIQVSVGTPGQPQTMVLDTGSSDVWVVAFNADLCRSSRLQNAYGDSCDQTYNPNDSNSYKLVDEGGFNIQYLDGSGSSGDYITDDVAVGGTTIKALQIGYATETVRGIGIMGVGFSNHEAALDQYPNIMDELVSQGLIGVKAFSLYLNDRRSDSGTILFGGLDTAKFIGPLGVVPILRDAQTGSFSTYTVGLTALAASFANGTGSNVTLPEGTVPALLDSGTTLSYVPDAMARQLANRAGAYTDYRNTGLTFIDCAALYSDGGLTISLSFGGGVTIAVPTEEVVLDVFDGYTNIPPGVPFDNPCLFGFQSTASFSAQSSSLSESNFVLLGDTFLRSAYVVYDLQHRQIGLAQANLNSSDTKVVEFQAAESGIPAATGVQSQVPFSGTPTGSGGGGRTLTVTATPSGKGNAAGPPARAPDRAVFVVMGVAGLFALLGGALVVL